MRALRALLGGGIAVVAALAACNATVLDVLHDIDDGGTDARLGFPGDGAAGQDGCSDAPTETDTPCPGADAAPDAATDAGIVDSGTVDASCDDLCPAAGGTCMKGTCQITCTNCTGTVCPPGVPCAITCNGAQSCVDIDCGRASSCAVTCKGGNNCAGIRCDSPSCLVHCENDHACTGTIYAAGSNAKVECVGANSCLAAITCCADTCNFSCPGATNCMNGLCCSTTSQTCMGDKPTTACTDVACSGH